MERIQSYRPRVSRETRMLLTAALIATVALWALARVRFPDRPAPQNPVQPLLTQLTPRPTFADLAAEIGALRPRLDPLLVPASATVAGLRLQDDVALAWRDPQQEAGAWSTDALLRDDRASGLTLVRVDRRSTQLPALWHPQPGGPRYFLAAVLQFQFHRALCAKAGHKGPLNECSIYNNKEAGDAFKKMLAMGASKPWQDALFELTGQRDMDASAILEYFAPLQKWLEEQNKGQQCGW
jgi:hypothetical protein